MKILSGCICPDINIDELTKRCKDKQESSSALGQTWLEYHENRNNTNGKKSASFADDQEDLEISIENSIEAQEIHRISEVTKETEQKVRVATVEQNKTQQHERKRQSCKL